MKLDFSDKTVGGFSFEFVRGISTQQVGAAEFGECVETLDRIKNNNFESWISEWTVTLIVLPTTQLRLFNRMI